MAKPGRKPGPRTQVHDIEILWDYYQRHQVQEPTGCISWDAGRHRQGYGMMGAWRTADGQKIMTTTHRIAARLAWDRPIASSEMVVHTCSQMNCMNPDHLVPGNRRIIHQIMRTNNRYEPRGKYDNYK